MVRSMTGYGRAEKQFDNRTISVEIKSVNNRYLDCSVRYPRLCAFLEEPVKARLKENGISRGKLDVYINMTYAEGDSAVTVNRGMVQAYLKAIHEMSAEFGLQDDTTVMQVARLPDVFTVEKVEEDRDALQAMVNEVLDEAVKAYNAMRAVEGERLVADVLEKAAVLEENEQRIRERMPGIVADYRQRLTDKLHEVLGSAGIDESRIVTEAAIYADHVATDEETVRLESHFRQLRQILAEGGPVGRKLDFLVQEINREINTIGSKASDLSVTNRIVNMKSELEKIREQIQNME